MDASARLSASTPELKAMRTRSRISSARIGCLRGSFSISTQPIEADFPPRDRRHGIDGLGRILFLAATIRIQDFDDPFHGLAADPEQEARDGCAAAPRRYYRID